MIPLQGIKAPSNNISDITTSHYYSYFCFSFPLGQTSSKESIIPTSSFLSQILTFPGTKSRMGVDHHVPNFVINYISLKLIFPKLNRYLQILISKNMRHLQSHAGRLLTRVNMLIRSFSPPF